LPANFPAHSFGLEGERPLQRVLRHVRGDEDGLGLCHGEVGKVFGENIDAGAEGKDCVLC